MSSLCREVITLQLGHFSNFVGTHWWNLQDASLSYDPESPPAEIRSDVVFREGQTPAGHVTYTPRLIAMDLKGSLQTLRQQGCLYDAGEDASALTWEGSLVTHKESPSEKNSFLKDLDQLDSPPRKSSKNSGRADTVNSQLNRIQRSYRLEGSVRVWSDFLRIHLHPRTVSVIHQYNHDGEAHRLEAFGQGESVLQGALLEELEDRLHFFVEECDYLQGFQILCDLGNGFAGLGSKVTELLQDSYGGRGILSWGLVPGAPAHSSPVKDLYRLLNCTLGMLHMATNSSLFCPLSLRGSLGRVPAPPPEFPHLYFDPSLWFHSSAVLALALDALTVPYRLRNNSPTMWQVADSLVVSGRKVVSAYGAVPFPMMHGSSLPDALTACAEGLPWKPLSTCPERGRCYGQWVTLRGFEGQKLVSHLPAGSQPPTPLHGHHSGEDVLAAYLTSFYPSTPLALQLVSAPSQLMQPFPQIFNSSLNAQGFLQSLQQPHAPPPAVASAPVLTSLQSGSALDSWLSEFHQAARGVDVRRVAPSFFSQGPEMADYEEALEQLHLLARCYRDDSGGRTQSSSEDED
uniref:Protein misato homolog 1 n=1 Tax=Oryzias sinensis TaxID=183150 RepID=A0A8C7ZMB9_9TELE